MTKLRLGWFLPLGWPAKGSEIQLPLEWGPPIKHVIRDKILRYQTSYYLLSQLLFTKLSPNPLHVPFSQSTPTPPPSSPSMPLQPPQRRLSTSPTAAGPLSSFNQAPRLLPYLHGAQESCPSVAHPSVNSPMSAQLRLRNDADASLFNPRPFLLYLGLPPRPAKGQSDD